MDEWRARSACYGTDKDFFTSDPAERYDARTMCHSECPVRKDCLQHALEQREIHGIWGGEDEYEIRRALSVNAEGKPVVRSRPPRCPYCKNRELTKGETKRKIVFVSCAGCGLKWTLPSLSISGAGRKHVSKARK